MIAPDEGARVGDRRREGGGENPVIDADYVVIPGLELRGAARGMPW